MALRAACSRINTTDTHLRNILKAACLHSNLFVYIRINHTHIHSRIHTHINTPRLHPHPPHLHPHQHPHPRPHPPSLDMFDGKHYQNGCHHKSSLLLTVVATVAVSHDAAGDGRPAIVVRIDGLGVVDGRP